MENSLLFTETSAKTAMNVNEMFLAISKRFNIMDIIILCALLAMRLSKVDPAASRQGSATGQRSSAGGRVIDVAHDESNFG